MDGASTHYQQRLRRNALAPSLVELPGTVEAGAREEFKTPPPTEPLDIPQPTAWPGGYRSKEDERAWNMLPLNPTTREALIKKLWTNYEKDQLRMHEEMKQHCGLEKLELTRGLTKN